MQNVTGSPNIATLDSKIIFDLCAGQSYIDISPSVWIGTGYDNVLGAKVQITNPLGVVIKPFPSGYDVTPATSGGVEAIISFPIPTQAGNYQYGKYSVSVQLVDADGTIYTDTKTVSICAPDANNKTRKYGTLSAKINGICSEGKVYILVSEPPTYKGVIAESTSQSFDLNYPTGSGMASEVTEQSSFSVQLFEGVYEVVGTVCAQYNFGDNVFVKVQYKVDYSKSVICSLDECCVFTGLEALNSKLNSDCSQAEKEDTQSRIEKATLLLSAIDFGIRCGQDVSDYIESLEGVLGLTCSCAFDNGTPLINNNPASDILIQGCNVEKEVVGLTTVYTLNLYQYVTSVVENGGALSISNQVLNGCVQSQSLTFNIATVYSQIKTQATPADSGKSLIESQFWAGVVKNSLNSIDASCLGITSDQLSALTLPAFIQKIIDKECAGGSCGATVDTTLATQQGGDVVLSWTSTGAYSFDVYVDSELKVTVLNTTSSWTAAGYADGVTHTYRIVSKCSNNIYGTALQNTFGFTGCPAINQPTVTSTSITNATCPFDLTGIVAALPAGITAEWHTANNHLPSSLVPDEQSVSDGVYYVFATNGNNCYSTGVRVVLTCAVSSSCSAPQSLAVTSVIGGLKISFSSALYPPPSNSYTVKRKLASAADIDASYITIGTPVYNASTAKYELTDTGALANTYYTYKAVSNCGATTPYVTVNYANISCPSVVLTSDETSISYSFSDTGGDIDKYEVELWDASGTTLLHTDTHLPSLVFPDPITGTFSYLDTGISYKVRIVPYIGAASFPCAFNSKYTLSALYASMSRSGSFSGTLSAFAEGGVPPYTYAFSCVATGDCEAHTIDTPNAQTSAYSCTAYGGTSYQFSVTVVDSIMNTVTATSAPTGACLVPETLIRMADNSEKQLADVHVGDELADTNLETGEPTVTTVLSEDDFVVPELYVINGGLLKASEGHIHIVKENGGYELRQSHSLVKGDVLVGEDLSEIEIETIEVQEGDIKVKTISTSTKQYIANGVATHNKLACP